MAAPDDYDPRVESEQSVLGALMFDTAKAWPQVKERLVVEHFGSAAHRAIFAAILASIEETGAAPATAVLEQLHERGHLELAMGQDYVAELIAGCASAEGLRGYIKHIRNAAGRGKVIDFAAEVQARAARLDPAEAAQLLTEEAERLRRDFGDEQEKPKPDRRPMRWASLQSLGDPPPREWRISHWLSEGATLMAGSGGVGKSLLAQTIATALALGRSFLDEVRNPSTVLMWACEDDHDEIWRRQIAICRFFGVPMSALDGRLIVEPRQGRENTLYDTVYGSAVWTPLFSELRDQVNDYHADTFFLDNIGQTYGAKENDRHQATVFVNGIAGLAPGISSIIMGHPAKTAESEFSGSGAWENAVRMRWYMGYRLPDQKPADDESEEDPNVRYIAKRKTNYSAKDFRKLTFENGLFAPEDKGPGDGFSDRWAYADRQAGAVSCVLDAVGQFVKQGIRVTDGSTSPDYLPKKMREAKLCGSFTPKELSGALSKLRLNGQLAEGPVGKYSNRTPKIGLVVAS